MTVSRPVLRWHGGKWILAPWIISHFPSHRVYVEPFGGAASVLMRKPRSYAEVYNDLDDEVVNLFRVLRSDSASDLVESLRLTPFAAQEFFDAYSRGGDDFERARRTVVKSFMGFGSNAIHRKSGFRSNSNRSGTTPARDWVNYPDSLARVIERLRGVVVLNRDAREVMEAHDGPDTLHYVDPPYVAATRDAGCDYAHEMTDADHRDLLEFLRTLTGRVVLSGYPHQSYDDALDGWRRIERASLADGARKRTEVLWMNFDDAQMQLFEVTP
ncbi:DNA adenine methylase [Salipiger bermudensis]|uniref:DNA adenine methylase n=1 Tax=Salipiger bermudensis TaxID=344736 RepID=UPI001C99A02A|nr:DNA adenine methylase [Salipiger bermudensis]MBY6005397.1 DNA adenine methylase [Salipiger bermudensis]